MRTVDPLPPMFVFKEFIKIVLLAVGMLAAFFVLIGFGW